MSNDYHEAFQPFPPPSELSIPTPSLRSIEYAKKFRMTLGLLTTVNIVWYFFGSFVSASDVAAVDMLLVFFGYYAQDLYRSSALKLYYLLASASVLIDTLSVLVKALIAFKVSHWATIILIVLFFVETLLKVASIHFAYTLHKHLDRVPGQSVEGI